MAYPAYLVHHVMAEGLKIMCTCQKEQPVKEKKFGDKTVKIFIDQDPQDPRKAWDNLGTIKHWHRRYDFGDGKINVQDAEAILDSNDYIAIPIFMYDHSGATIKAAYENPFHCQWDSGCVGVAYVSKEKVKKEWNVSRISKKLRQTIIQNLISEVETLNHYISGYVYGFVIENADGVEEDSCWGYYEDPESVIKLAAEEHGLKEVKS